jgi:isocitrate dehydrogenase
LDAATPALSRMLGSTKTTITAIPGDGIGPEVMRAVQRVLAAAGANLEWEEAEAGAAVFKRGIASGCPQDTLDSIARTGRMLP